MIEFIKHWIYRSGQGEEEGRRMERDKPDEKKEGGIIEDGEEEGMVKRRTIW